MAKSMAPMMIFSWVTAGRLAAWYNFPCRSTSKEIAMGSPAPFVPSRLSSPAPQAIAGVVDRLARNADGSWSLLLKGFREPSIFFKPTPEEERLLALTQPKDCVSFESFQDIFYTPSLSFMGWITRPYAFELANSRDACRLFRNDTLADRLS
jgi:hypothetical protein